MGMIERGRSVTSAAVLLFVLTPTQFAVACLANYRSPDYLVATSPLIILGEVQKIEEVNPEATTKARPTTGYAQLRLTNSSDRTPQPVAIVRVIEVLKGTYEPEELRVVPGPINSCLTGQHYFELRLGARHLFILPHRPHDGLATLEWGGSLLSVTDRQLVESRIAQTAQFHREALNAVELLPPKTQEGARELVSQFHSAANRLAELCPDDSPPRDEQGREVTRQIRECMHKTDLVKREIVAVFASAPLESIVAALVLDWQNPDLPSITQSALWFDVERSLKEIRSEEILSYEKARIKSNLLALQISPDNIVSYLGGITIDDISFHFPHSPPKAYRKLDPQDLTTDFLLRFDSFYRGDMYYAYGMQMESLAKLDRERVKSTIPALLGSDDERLCRIAMAAIQRIPGQEFVTPVFEAMQENPRLWRALKNEKDTEETHRRLAALLDHGQKNWPPEYPSGLWRLLLAGEFFESVAVERATAILESGEDDLELVRTLHQFLESAQLHQKWQSRTTK